MMSKEDQIRTPNPAPTSFGGRGVRHLRLRDRGELEQFVARGPISSVPALEAIDLLVRDAHAMSPANLSGLRDRMARLQHEWESIQADERVEISGWIESICLPWIEARVPLRGNGLEPAWAADLLLALFADFDSSGQVIETVDPGWRRPTRGTANVGTTARLAVAAGWSSWSHLIVDPALAGSALTVLGDLLDRLDGLSHEKPGHHFSADDRAWTRAALALERRLLRHWHRGSGSVH